MGVKKRRYKTKDGEKESKHWSYEFFIDKGRFQDTLDGVAKLPEGYELPKGKTLETINKSQAEEITRKLKEQKEKELSGGVVCGVTFDEAAALFYTDYLAKLNKRRNKALI